MVTLAGNVV